MPNKKVIFIIQLLAIITGKILIYQKRLGQKFNLFSNLKLINLYIDLYIYI